MTPLNENQKLFLWVGIAGIVAMGLFPPWVGLNMQPAGVGFLYSPPELSSHIAVKLDITRLLVEWGMAAIVTVGMILTAQTAPVKSGSQANSSSAQPTHPESKQPTTASTAPAQKLAKVQLEAPKTEKTNGKSAQESSRSLKFPDISLGEVLIESIDDPDYWDGIGEARGVVQIPKDCNVQLEALKTKPMHLAKLSELAPDALHSIDLSGSEVDDSDLQHVAHLSKLVEIDLSDTSISDEGVETLVKIPSLKKVWLDNTKVTDASLDNLKQLTKLTKVSFTGCDIAEASVKAAKNSFPEDCEIVLASGIKA